MTALASYRLSESDLEIITSQRIKTGANGNSHEVGQVVPLLIVRRWPGDAVNGQAILDGEDSLWVQSARQGDEPGNWSPEQ